jgi:ornithine carrier protein
LSLYLHQGLASPVFGSAFENAVLFTAFGQTNRLLWGKDSPAPMPMVLVSGMIGGVAVATVLTPVELVKCRMQVTRECKAGERELERR